jgi:hypothetical protein
VTETFFVPFDYAVHLAGRHGGKTALRRDTAAIQVPSVRADELQVAYIVRHRDDLGPGRHLVLRHQGRLWWPLADASFPLEIKTARDFLIDLRAGQSELFARPLEDHEVRDYRRHRILHDEHDAKLAAVHRAAKNLLIVDDRLYACGAGVPLVVDASWGVRIAGTGDDRVSPMAPTGGPEIRPCSA